MEGCENGEMGVGKRWKDGGWRGDGGMVDGEMGDREELGDGGWGEEGK